MITLVTIDIVLLCILLLLGVPVTLSFGAALLFLVASGFVSMNSLMLVGFSSVLNPVLLAIPLFIFARHHHGRKWYCRTSPQFRKYACG